MATTGKEAVTDYKSLTKGEKIALLSSSESHMARVLLDLYRQWVADGRPMRTEPAKAT